MREHQSIENLSCTIDSLFFNVLYNTPVGRGGGVLFLFFVRNILHNCVVLFNKFPSSWPNGKNVRELRPEYSVRIQQCPSKVDHFLPGHRPHASARQRCQSAKSSQAISDDKSFGSRGQCPVQWGFSEPQCFFCHFGTLEIIHNLFWGLRFSSKGWSVFPFREIFLTCFWGNRLLQLFSHSASGFPPFIAHFVSVEAEIFFVTSIYLPASSTA